MGGVGGTRRAIVAVAQPGSDLDGVAQYRMAKALGCVTAQMTRPQVQGFEQQQVRSQGAFLGFHLVDTVSD